MSRDDFNKGQEDRSDSEGESTLDLVIGGGASRHYDPPSDEEGKADYDEGWRNNH